MKMTNKIIHIHPENVSFRPSELFRAVRYD